MFKVQTEGRRHYIVGGNTYPHRERIGADCHFDGERWWTGKAAVAAALVAELNSQPAADHSPPTEGVKKDPSQGKAPGEEATVAGRVNYKGRTYYLAGKIERSGTRAPDRVEAVTTRDGARMLLYFLNGSGQFWAAGKEVQVLKTFSRPQTIGGLRQFAQKAKTFGTSECRCRCHQEVNAGKPGSILFDGCDTCGCEV